MVGFKILEQRASVGEDELGQQTNEKNMDGCGRTEKAGTGGASGYGARVDQSRGMFVRMHRQGDSRGARMCREENWRDVALSGAVRARRDGNLDAIMYNMSTPQP